MESSGSFENLSFRYEATLSSAVSRFRSLLASPNSRLWKQLPPNINPTQSEATSSGKTKGKAADLINDIGPVDLLTVQVHKRADKGPDILRATVEVCIGEGCDLENWKAVLKTPEVRSAWDKLVDQAHAIELSSPQIRISKTDYRLGWPASPRDTITISKMFSDSSTLIDVSTSLPRSEDEPAFLRPAPPYVRSHVHLFAWCIQLLPPTVLPSAASNFGPVNNDMKARIILFWQWSLKGAVFATHSQQIAQVLGGFVEYVRERGDQIPLLSGFGRCVEVTAENYDIGQETRIITYTIVAEDDIERKKEIAVKGIDELADMKERKRLERSIELSLSPTQGWDVRIQVKGVGRDEVDTSWIVIGEQVTDGRSDGRMIIRFVHATISKIEHLVRATVSVQRLAGGKGVKVNGKLVAMTQMGVRDPSFATFLLQDSASTSHNSVLTTASGSSDAAVSSAAALAAPAENTHLKKAHQAPLPSAASAEIAALLRRNYIYFTSLLQEPEAKWRHISDAQGVTVTQLNSIDPTLTIYRAEATFVGVGVWDVFSTICTPGARMYWDKTLEDANLLEDINELSSLWHIKMKPSWPVAPRDSVTVRTVYKSPSSVHVYSFSTDDERLFPSIPRVASPVIRTQTDLYGWAIEALSPTTTQITLLDQSDPKGWSNKSWTPSQLVNAIAGVGDFSIKVGGPPVLTRLAGARATLSRYDHEKGTLRLEYRAPAINAASLTVLATPNDNVPILAPPFDPTESDTTIECEIRCDLNTWASSVDLVVDPPPFKVSCLSRHRLSSGGGLWLTIEHLPSTVNEDRIMVNVRRGGNRDKGCVSVNGAKVKVDLELLPNDEIELLSKKKRVKVSPIPLDQYPSHGPRVWHSLRGQNGDLDSPGHATEATRDESSMDSFNVTKNGETPGLVAKAPNPIPVTASSPLDTRHTKHVPQLDDLPAPSRALEALSWLQTFHAEQGPELTDPAPGWAIVSERGGTVVRKKNVPGVSEALPVYRGDKIVQGLTADEISAVVSSIGCRQAWDDRIERATQVASYGYGCSTSTLITKPTFPFKGRVFHLASVNAQVRVPSASASSSTSTVLFRASASYDAEPTTVDLVKLNPTMLLTGNVLLEGWILETLDPYTSSVLAIPSTRCTYVICVDHRGSVPFALNSVLNANLARLIGAVEGVCKNKGPIPRTCMPDCTLQIEGALMDDGDEECVWKLSNTKAEKILLSSDYQVDEGVFEVLISASPKAVKKSASHSLLKSITYKSSTHSIVPSSPSFNPAKADLIRTSLSNPNSSPTSALLISKSSPELARKGSKGSLRSSALENKRADSLRSSDASIDSVEDNLVIMEILVDLKLHPHGYAIHCHSSFGAKATPIDLESSDVLVQDIPVAVKVFNAPLPSIVSASLDSTKRANHLVRVYVPNNCVSHIVQDPLRESEKPKHSPPEWYKRLIDEGGLFQLRIKGVPQSLGETGEKSSPTMRVLFNEGSVEVIAERKLFSNFTEDGSIQRGALISRIPRNRKQFSDSAPLPLPKEFQSPLAIRKRLLKTSALDLDSSDEIPQGAKSPVQTATTSSSSLSRLPSRDASASEIKPLSSRRGTTTLDSLSPGPLLGILGANPLSRLSSSMTTTSQLTENSATPARRTYTLSFVLIVAVISFLLGSLLRSLLSPADYIMYGQGDQTKDEVERLLMKALDPVRPWREAKRLFEVRSFVFSNWDLIFAAVRREH